ncbi:GMC-type oxidoreductase [Penicillium argentinense]|uniref:GMC-type oxidoreductase n=1 Tax=Penicillium argentinense TaxID=1131581 RepID=A0A9W9EWR3_9EURO|nr:GMC-type oxidoreductase [Penicillium argentinense]KAJ5089374.1 GMC-type oxidoreductase [Penicillium argentinense]
MPRNSDEAMDTMILERSQTGYYPCGTYSLSKSMDKSVVDGQLKVHGFKNVRVIDVLFSTSFRIVVSKIRSI